MGADLIEEMPVVADDDHRRVRLVQHLLEPADRVDVEVVGRLIEQQHIRVREQGLREQHAQLEAGRDLAHGAVVEFFGDAGLDEDGRRARLGVVAAVLGETHLELRGAHVIVVGGGRVGVDRVTRRHRRPHLGMTLHDDIDDPLVFVAELVLAELPEPEARLQHHIARALLEIAAQDLHQGRLAAAVGADQTITVAVGELDRHPLEQGFGAELDGEIGCREHGGRGVYTPPPALARSGILVFPMGATGFDVGCEPPGACRGAVNLVKLCCKHLVANDNNYALAA